MMPQVATALRVVARKCKNHISKPLSAGANPNFIASQMGHANAQRVYQVYGSWMKENDEAQRSLLNEKLNEFVPSMPHTKAI